MSNPIFQEADSIFAGINFDEGDDSWGLGPGVWEVVISNVALERSKSQTLGLWVTFSDDRGKSVRKWVTMPEPDQDDDTRKRNTTFLKMFLKNIQLPEEKWKKLEPEDFIGLECTITVKPQKDNEEYMNVSRIQRRDASRTHGTVPDSSNAAVPSNGGFNF